MNEKKRERFYFILALCLLISAPVTIWACKGDSVAAILKFDAAWNIGLPLGSSFLVIIFEILFSAVRHGGLRGRMFVKDPSSRSERDSAFDSVSELAVAKTRLRALGFRVFAQTETALEYDKEKMPSDESFIAHRFTGVLESVPGPQRCRLRNTLTMNDTLILDTHERKSIKALSDFIVGASTKLDLHIVPLTALSGLLQAALMSVAMWMNHFHVGLCEGSILSVMPVAAMLNLYATFIVWNNRERFVGLRISLIALALCFIPILAYLVMPVISFVSR